MRVRLMVFVLTTGSGVIVTQRVAFDMLVWHIWMDSNLTYCRLSDRQRVVDGSSVNNP